LMRSASATEVPPNFITTVPDTVGKSRSSLKHARTGMLQRTP
jgi:hypothetical protein